MENLIDCRHTLCAMAKPVPFLFVVYLTMLEVSHIIEYRSNIWVILRVNYELEITWEAVVVA